MRTLEQMTVTMAEDVESFRAAQAAPPAAEEGSILVVTADGKGVPMRREPEETAAIPRRRRRKGEKANKKRQACVGAVYTIDAFFRTASDVVDEIRRRRRHQERPEPCHKHVRAART